MTDSICSILNASLCTYGIGKPGGVRSNPVAKYVGFTDAPIAEFQAGLAEIDACYVGETKDSVILAFRGTSLGKNDIEQALIDWINNFLAKPVSVEDIPGELHEGFSNSIERLWEKGFQGEVTSRMAGGKPLIITGYSKGGGLTPIAAAFLNKKLNVDANRISVFMFEPPRAGDATFQKYFNATFPTAVRYEYKDDIVPHVPPNEWAAKLLEEIPWLGKILEKYEDLDEWNYKSVGTLKFVNWNGDIVDYSLGLYLERVAHLGELAIGGKILQAGKDHLPKGHLYKTLCSNPWPEDLVLTL